MGTTAAQPQYFPQNLFQEGDTFSYVKGPHTWKMGVDVERFQLASNGLNSQRGTYSFASLRDFIANQPNQLTFSLVGGASSPNRGWRQTLFGWFVQDDFRVRPNLTLNLGFRHEFLNTPAEVNGRSANLIRTTDVESTLGPPWRPHKKSFAPRVGLAWDPFGKGKTSVRVGTGVFFNQLTGRTWYLSSQNDHRFNITYQIRNPVFPNALANGLTTGSKQEQTNQYQHDTPTTVHYNLDVQQQLTPTISAHAGYVGSNGRNFTDQESENIRIAQILADGSKFFAANAPFVNPNFSTIRRVKTRSYSNYNALQAGLSKSFSRGLLLQANYTWSKNMGTADALSSSQLYSINAYVLDINNLARDYSYAAFDMRHSLVINTRYKLPFDHFKSRIARAAIGGWEINGILQVNAGLPLDILDGFNNSNNGDNGQPDRPSLAPGYRGNPTHGTTAGCQGVPAGQKVGTPDLWFNPCAFVLSPAGTFGNVARNSVIGPAYRNLDFSMAKNFALREGMNLEFRAEVFNIFNHANFAAPLNPLFTANRVASGNAGVITSTANANREIQFGLKLTF